MSRRPLLAGLAAGLMMTGAALAAPASALVGAADDPGTTESASRLPFQAEIARIYPDAEGGTRVSQPGTGIRGPASGLTDEYDEACLGEQVRVRGTSGRTAVYKPGADAEAPPRPTVQERTFPTAADARGAFAEMRSAIRECKGGTYRTRTEDYTWYQRSAPVVGQDRIGWSLRSDTATDGTTTDLHYLVLKDDRLIHTVVSQRDTLPDQAQAQQLLRLSLRTLG